jgi:hypothetical protein
MEWSNLSGNFGLKRAEKPKSVKPLLAAVEQRWFSRNLTKFSSVLNTKLEGHQAAEKPVADSDY